MSYLTDVVGSRDLFVNLTLRELRGKYKRSFLGWAWSLLNPLATMAIFTLVFSVLLKSNPPPGDPSGLHVFALFLLCGLLPWNYLSNSMTGGMYTLVGNANLIKKVYFPREVLVAANVTSWLFSLLIEMAVLLVALLAFGNMVLPWLPVVLVLMADPDRLRARCRAHAVGAQRVLPRHAAPGRDRVAGLVLRHADHLPDHARPAAHQRRVSSGSTNSIRWPSSSIAYRNVLYDLRWPTLGNIAYLVVVSIATLVVGALVFRRFEGRLAEEL